MPKGQKRCSNFSTQTTGKMGLRAGEAGVFAAISSQESDEERTLEENLLTPRWGETPGGKAKPRAHRLGMIGRNRKGLAIDFVESKIFLKAISSERRPPGLVCHKGYAP